MPEPDRGPPCAPPAAVITRLGNRSAVLAPTSATAAARYRSASRISGRRRSRSTGSPTGARAGSRGTAAGPPQVARQRLRVFSHQHGDRVAAGRDQRLERCDVGLQRCDLTLGERHVQFVGQPAIQAGLGQIEHLARGLDIAIENLKAILPGPQVKVQTSDIGGDYNINPVARLLERFGGIGLRLDAARDLAEHVDLPFGVETADLVDALVDLWRCPRISASATPGPWFRPIRCRRHLPPSH